MSYGMPYKPRQPAQQVWAVGEWVQVGFMRLRIMGGSPSRGWELVNKAGDKRYTFTPHHGLQANN